MNVDDASSFVAYAPSYRNEAGSIVNTKNESTPFSNPWNSCIISAFPV